MDSCNWKLSEGQAEDLLFEERKRIVQLTAENEALKCENKVLLDAVNSYHSQTAQIAVLREVINHWLHESYYCDGDVPPKGTAAYKAEQTLTNTNEQAEAVTNIVKAAVTMCEQIRCESSSYEQDRNLAKAVSEYLESLKS